MRRNLIVVAAVMPILTGSVCAQRQATRSTAADSATYDSVLARVVSGDTTVDFTAFRMLAAKVARSPKPAIDPAAEFARAREAADTSSARAHVDSVIESYGGNIRAHMDAARFYEQRGDSTRARQERAIVRAFVASIGANGGRTEQTAMPVTSIAEEYAFLSAHGVRVESQGLIACGQGMCDAMTGPDTTTGVRVTYYFRLVWW